jgi:SOS-response transcriptional repressor LexA
MGDAVTGPTRIQRRVLDEIVTATRSRGYPPTLRELGAALGMSAASTVQHHVDGLVRAGLVARDPGRPRAIRVLEHDGRCSACGQALPGDECAACMAGDASTVTCDCELTAWHVHLRCDGCGKVWSEA